MSLPVWVASAGDSARAVLVTTSPVIVINIAVIFFMARLRSFFAFIFLDIWLMQATIKKAGRPRLFHSISV